MEKSLVRTLTTYIGHVSPPLAEILLPLFVRCTHRNCATLFTMWEPIYFSLRRPVVGKFMGVSNARNSGVGS